MKVQDPSPCGRHFLGSSALGWPLSWFPIWQPSAETRWKTVLTIAKSRVTLIENIVVIQFRKKDEGRCKRRVKFCLQKGLSE